MANTNANAKNIIYPYLGDLTEKEAELIFTRGKGVEGIPSPEKPIFVLLFGTPGSGKSTALRKMKQMTELNPDDAVQINLDSLIESLQPFRNATRKIATNMLNQKGFIDYNSANQNTISEIAGKASGPYLSMMRSKKNNRPGRIGKPLSYSPNELRFLILEKALAHGKNIIYERTVSDAKKDTLASEVFEKIQSSGKPYEVYIIYTKIDDESQLRERLRKRPLAMLKRDPPFFRGVPPSLAGKFINAHEEYFRKYLQPRIEAGEAKGRVVFSDGRENLYMNGGSGKRKRKLKSITRKKKSLGMLQNQ